MIRWASFLSVNSCKFLDVLKFKMREHEPPGKFAFTGQFFTPGMLFQGITDIFLLLFGVLPKFSLAVRCFQVMIRIIIVASYHFFMKPIFGKVGIFSPNDPNIPIIEEESYNLVN